MCCGQDAPVGLNPLTHRLPPNDYKGVSPMDQEYFYVEMPSGTVVSYTTEKAAESAAAAYDGKRIRGKAADKAEPGTAPGVVVEGAHIAGDATATVATDGSTQQVATTGEPTVEGAEHGVTTGRTTSARGRAT